MKYLGFVGAAGLGALAALAGSTAYSWTWKERKPLRVLITGAAGLCRRVSLGRGS